MVLFDTSPTLYKRMAKSVTASKRRSAYEAIIEVGPTLFSPQPLNDPE